MSDPVYTPDESEVAWLRRRVEYLEAKLAEREQGPSVTLPAPPATLVLPESVRDAIRLRSEPGGAGERHLIQQAERMLAKSDEFTVDDISKILLDGEAIEV